MADEETIEIRCLWQRTDYGYIGLLAAARGYGGREAGSYQDRITDERFAEIRDREQHVNPEWRLAESVVKVDAGKIEALFTDGTVIEGDSLASDTYGDKGERCGGTGRLRAKGPAAVFAGAYSPCPGCADCSGERGGEGGS